MPEVLIPPLKFILYALAAYIGLVVTVVLCTVLAFAVGCVIVLLKRR